jgi:hypothetical protein
MLLLILLYGCSQKKHQVKRDSRLSVVVGRGFTHIVGPPAPFYGSSTDPKLRWKVVKRNDVGRPRCLPCIIPIRQYDAGSGSVDDINVDDAGSGRTVEISLRSTYSLHDAILPGLANTCTVEPEVQFRNPLPRAPRRNGWPLKRGSESMRRQQRPYVLCFKVKIPR